MTQGKRTEIYQITLYRKNDGFEGTAKCRQGSGVEQIVNSSSIHGLAREAAQVWEPKDLEVAYVTVQGPTFDPKKGIAIDPITAREMKDFHYWYLQHLHK